MRKLGSLMAIVFLFTACQEAPHADKATATEAKPVKAAQGTPRQVDLGQSKIEFVGSKPTGKHHGTIQISQGNIIVNNNTVTGGNIIIDINSLKTDDQDSAANAKLSTHLLSPDFFNAAQYPSARFEISAVTEGTAATGKDLVAKDATHMVTGNLILKDQSRSISFPARISVDDEAVTADANFNIDRTQWGLNYRSSASLGNKFIDPVVNVQFHLVAQ